jgi:hypothetical protein
MSLPREDEEFLFHIQRLSEKAGIWIKFKNIAKVIESVHINKINMDNELNPDDLQVTIEMTFVGGSDIISTAKEINDRKELPNVKA